MSIHSTLESHIEALHTLYERNFQVVRTLQRTLLEEILPALEDELEMDAEKVAAARQWLEDTRTCLSVRPHFIHRLTHV